MQAVSWISWPADLIKFTKAGNWFIVEMKRACDNGMWKREINFSFFQVCYHGDPIIWENLSGPIRHQSLPNNMDKETTDNNFSKLRQRSRDLTSGSASSSSPSWLSSMSARSGLLNLSSSSMARVRLSGCDTNGCWNETGRELVRRHRLNESNFTSRVLHYSNRWFAKWLVILSNISASAWDYFVHRFFCWDNWTVG